MKACIGQAKELDWLTVAKSDAVQEGDSIVVEFEGEEVAVFRIGGLLYAIHDVCTHSFASLASGYLDGFEVECPIHQGRFDVRTGRPMREPCEVPLRVYRVREANGDVQLSNAPFEPA